MRNKFWILGVTAVSLMVGCSNNDEIMSSGTNGIGLDMSNSDVEIRLASSTDGTRASVESTPAGLFEADGLGIFCLAKSAQGVNPAELDIVWNRSNEFAVWMPNVSANAVFNADTTMTEITWGDGKKRFYPVANWYTYRFYGYYPRVEDNNITYGKTRVEAHIPIDGTQDVIWGRTNNNHKEAYSAKYFRNLEFADETPGIKFEHKLMRITFSVVPGSDANGSYDAALTMGVESIKIKNVPSVANLIVADFNDANIEGSVSYDWAYGVADFELRDSLDTPFRADHWLQMEETTLGQGILLPVPDEYKADQHYYVAIVLKDKNGNRFESEHPIELQSSTYGAGKSYNVKMTVHGPKLVTLSATLNPWDVDTDGTINDVTL